MEKDCDELSRCDDLNTQHFFLRIRNYNENFFAGIQTEILYAELSLQSTVGNVTNIHSISWANPSLQKL